MSPKINLKKILSYIIPPVITVGLCYVLYSGVDFGSILADGRMCNPWLAMAFLAFNVVAMLARGFRWRLQLRAVGANPSAAAMSRSIFGTYAVNIVFPRLGEFWRCTYISRIAARPFSEVFGTMVADRLSDTIVVLLLCIVTFLFSTSAFGSFLESAHVSVGFLTSWSALAIYMLIAAFILYVVFGKGGFACKIRGFCLRTWRGFTVIFKMPRKGKWLVYTLIVWGSYIGSMWVSMLAFPPTAALISVYGLQCVMVAFVFGSLSMAIPSNGGIGPWQFAVMLSLGSLYGLDNADALTFATLNLGANTLLNICLGLYTFIHIGIKKD